MEQQNKESPDDAIAEAFFRLQANKEHLDTATKLLVEFVERAMMVSSDE